MQRATIAYQKAIEELAGEGVPPLINPEEVSKEITSHGAKVMMSSYIAAFKGNAYKNYNQIIESTPEPVRQLVVDNALRKYVNVFYKEET